MTVYIAHTGARVEDDLAGPWEEIRVVADDLCFVVSDDSLSRVYHEIKWSLPEDAALLVAPLAGRPKLKHLPAGTTTWLRDRLAPYDG